MLDIFLKLNLNREMDFDTMWRAISIIRLFWNKSRFNAVNDAK